MVWWEYMQGVEEKFGTFSNCSWHSVPKMKQIVQKGIVGKVIRDACSYCSSQSFSYFKALYMVQF